MVAVLNQWMSSQLTVDLPDLDLLCSVIMMCVTSSLFTITVARKHSNSTEK